MSRIELAFPDGTKRISGNPLGRAIYRDQVENIIKLNEKTVIIFPPCIEKVGISFVQGFFMDLINELGIKKTMDMIDIETGNPKLTLDIYEKLSRGEQ